MTASSLPACLDSFQRSLQRDVLFFNLGLTLPLTPNPNPLPLPLALTCRATCSST
jgi:hypothetical protein